MSAWLETYRGSVAPWECDMTEHFTIGYYFDRLGQAGLEIADRLGLGEVRRAALGARRFAVRFARELRAGAGFHIESALIGLDPALRLGHRVVDSAGAAGFIATARGRAMPADLDESGVFSLGAFVHRFTDACLQTMAAIGADAAYMQAERRGYSTFELALEIDDAPRLGDPYLVETGIAHLGNSSVRLVHHMSDPRSGRRLARLGQFGVQLDLDRRRPAALPQEIRERAARLLIAPA
jgi:acyl-CoA thioesterase FadM